MIDDLIVNYFAENSDRKNRAYDFRHRFSCCRLTKSEEVSWRSSIDILWLTQLFSSLPNTAAVFPNLTIISLHNLRCGWWCYLSSKTPRKPSGLYNLSWFIQLLTSFPLKQASYQPNSCWAHFFVLLLLLQLYLACQPMNLVVAQYLKM